MTGPDRPVAEMAAWGEPQEPPQTTLLDKLRRAWPPSREAAYRRHVEDVWARLAANAEFRAGMERARQEHETVGFQPFVHKHPRPSRRRLLRWWGRGRG